jgi:hypothetical protein
MLSRLRSWFSSGAADPTSRYGCEYIGNFEADGTSVTGVVEDRVGHVRVPPISLIVRRDGVEVGSTSEFEWYGSGWRFAVQIAGPVTSQDILRDRLKIVAVDRVGGESALTMLGAAQMEFLRAAHGPTTEQDLLITFTQDGNSLSYVQDGWSGPERNHTWTEGTHSTIRLPFAYPGARYRLELFLWPFVVRDKLEGQTLSVSISGMLIGKFYPSQGQQLLEMEIPEELTQSAEAIIRFDHPDAARPSELGDGNDGRMLALAFRRLRLRRYLDTPA